MSGWTGRQRILDHALDRIQDAPKHDPREGIKDALTLAHRLTAGRGNARVVLLSDGVWNEPPAAALLAGVDAVYFGTTTPLNTGIVTFSARRSLAAPGDWIVAASVERFGGAATDGELEITRNGQTLDVQPLSTSNPANPGAKPGPATPTKPSRSRPICAPRPRTSLPPTTTPGRPSRRSRPSTSISSRRRTVFSTRP